MSPSTEFPPPGIGPEGLPLSGVDPEGFPPSGIGPEGLPLSSIDPEGLLPPGVDPEELPLPGVDPEELPLPGVDPAPRELGVSPEPEDEQPCSDVVSIMIPTRSINQCGLLLDLHMQNLFKTRLFPQDLGK